MHPRLSRRYTRRISISEFDYRGGVFPYKKQPISEEIFRLCCLFATEGRFSTPFSVGARLEFYREKKLKNCQRKDKRQFYWTYGTMQKEKRPIKTGFCRSKQLWFKASACCCKGMSSVAFFLNCNSLLRLSKFNLPSSQRPVPSPTSGRLTPAPASSR